MVEVKVTAFAKVISCPHLHPLYIPTWFVAISFALSLAVICLTLALVSNIFYDGVQDETEARRVSF